MWIAFMTGSKSPANLENRRNMRIVLVQHEITKKLIQNQKSEPHVHLDLSWSM